MKGTTRGRICWTSLQSRSKSDTCERGVGRKEDWAGRASDHSTGLHFGQAEKGVLQLNSSLDNSDIPWERTGTVLCCAQSLGGVAYEKHDLSVNIVHPDGPQLELSVNFIPSAGDLSSAFPWLPYSYSQIGPHLL